jgi:hypothetical protein
MAFMIAANKQGRIAKQDWRLAFFALGPTPGNTFNLLQTKKMSTFAFLHNVQLLITVMG